MISILLCAFVALSLVQAAGAAELSAAPLNPDFINYFEKYFDEEHGTAVEIACIDTNSENATTKQVFSGGIIPAPSTPYWPSGEQDRSNVRAANTANAVGICADAAPLPSYFNLRDEGRLTPVRDQGKCGSCWAFAAYGSLESTLLTDTGVSWDFSESNMNNLCSSPYQDSFDYGHCNGGDAPMSTAYLARWSGPVNEADDPYLLPIPSTESSTFPPEVHVQNVSWLPPRKNSQDNDLLKQTVYEKGAIHVAFNVNLSCFGQDVTDYHNATNYYLPPEGYISDGGHAVTLAGWNDDYPAANFTVTPPGDGAFIIKNSWGTTACDEGFLYISYYDSSFDTEGYASVLFTAEPVGRLNTIYQYDPLGWTSRIGYTNTTCYGANVFTADSDEDLRAVSFYTTEPGTEYVAAVFRDIDTPPGNDAGPVAWVSGSADLPGYHTIPLLESVSLSPGQTFSVVLKVTAPTDIRPLVVERPVDGYSGKATALPGQSYVSEDGDKWDDLTTSFADTNVCIKAFTTDAFLVPTNYDTIQSAVNAARAGDTVIVESGTYRENVVLNTTITLRGRDTGDGFPVIDACGNGTALLVNANGVTVEDIELTGAGEDSFWDAGICVEANNATLINLTARENTFEGIVIHDSKNTTLMGCSALSNTGLGIYIEDSSGSTLTDCKANGNGNGISVINSPGSTLTDCIANDNAGNGIRIYRPQCVNNPEACTDATALSSHSNVIEYLSEADTTGMHDDPMLRTNSLIPMYMPLENEQEMSISEKGEVGTYATSGYPGVSLTGCQANSNNRGGFIIGETSSAQLTNCSASGNTYGMYLSYSENCTLMNNSMDGNLYNFNIEGRIDTEYTHSIDTSNTVDGKPIYYLQGATENPEEDFVNAGTIFAVGCSGLDIHDLALSGNKFGIYFLNTTSSVITDVTTEENEYGILLETSSDIRIDTCDTSRNRWDGIYLYDCSAIEADNCRATENGNLGIHLYKSKHCTLTGNAMDDNEYNFNIEGWEDANYYHSIDTSNTVNGKSIYYLLNATANPKGDFADAGILYAINCTGLDIHDLTLSNEYAGVCILKCSGLDIRDLTLTDNNLGIMISTSTDIALDSIRATENYCGIYLESCSESTIQGCIGQNNSIWLSSRFSDNNLITDCTMRENGRYGIELDSSENCTVRNCTASVNNYGFIVYNSENCHISECTASLNNYGFIIHNSKNGHISECTASNNTKSGLKTDFSNNCIVSLNSFVNNSAAVSSSHDILWNTPSPLTYLYGEHMWKQTSPMGNYWGAAYNGTDLNGDGIGDTPFIGDGFNDTYPLMSPLDAYTFVGDTDAYSDGGNGADSGHVSAAGNLNAGDAVEMQFSGTAVTGVTITAAGQITMMVVTIGPVQTGPEGLSGPVYQYLEADLIHTTNTAIGEATFTFDVPTAWLTAQGLTPADVVLWRFHDGVWMPLPTEIVSEGANTIVYRAVSPGFSYFAVGTGAGAGAVAVPADTPVPAETPISKPVTESPADPVVPSETGEETVAATTVTPPQGTPAGVVTLLTGLGAAALLFRRH